MKFRLAFLFCAFTLAGSAATSTVWEVSGFADFIKGHLSGLSLSADGLLQLGPGIRWRSPLNQPALWSLAVAPDQTIYGGTGHQGQVFRITPDGKFSVLWSASQPEVFALAVDTKGVLYAGTSPNGGLFRLDHENAREVWHCPVKYIWSLQAAPDGSLYVGTGEQGRIYRIDPNGNTDIYYETGQSNVTALALGPNGHLYAGTDPNGLLYNISGPKTGTILFDSSLPEIRSIAVDARGSVYASGMGGAVATRSGSTTSASSLSSGPVVSTTPTVVTVTEAKQGSASADDQQSGLKSNADPSRTSTSTVASTSTTPSSTVVEVSGVEKSAIYRISPDHTIETVRSSKEDNVYDLLLDGGSVIFATDDRGRIYRLDGARSTMVAELGDGEATRLLKSGSRLISALSNPGRLIALDNDAPRAGVYESQVHDCTSIARWGHLQWHGTGAGLIFRTRTGNAGRPDNTWSAWSPPITGPSDALIQSPPARFIQWRAEWTPGSTAVVNTVDIPYLPQNTPPVVRSISITSVVGTNASKTAGASSSTGPSSGAYSITVTDTGETPAASSSTNAAQTASRLQTTQTQISWQAEDPDGDKLVYSVYFRAEEQTAWQLIRSRMSENTLLLDPDVFADGRYFFRVVASDAPSNAVEYAHEAELVSTPVLIDNTPPLVTLSAPQRNGTVLDLDAEATDASSPLRRCEYSLDAGFWQPVEAVDGITDSPHERFHIHLEKLRPGEHLLVVRVYDSANNAGLARVVMR